MKKEFALKNTNVKYKREDAVRIVSERNGHGFSVGEIVRICEIYRCGDDEHYYAVSNDDGWYVWPDEIAPVKAVIL